MSYIMDLRKKVGKQTLIMPCACVILGDGKGNILLQQRVDNHLWSYHGGAIEIDETVEEALHREIKEELNIQLDEFHFFKIYSGKEMHHIYPNGDEVSPIDIVFYCHQFHGNICLQEEEVLAVKWFNETNLPKMTQQQKKVLQDYFRYLKSI